MEPGTPRNASDGGVAGKRWRSGWPAFQLLQSTLEMPITKVAFGACSVRIPQWIGAGGIVACAGSSPCLHPPQGLAAPPGNSRALGLIGSRPPHLASRERHHILGPPGRPPPPSSRAQSLVSFGSCCLQFQLGSTMFAQEHNIRKTRKGKVPAGKSLNRRQPSSCAFISRIAGWPRQVCVPPRRRRGRRRAMMSLHRAQAAFFLPLSLLTCE